MVESRRPDSHNLHDFCIDVEGLVHVPRVMPVASTSNPSPAVVSSASSNELPMLNFSEITSVAPNDRHVVSAEIDYAQHPSKTQMPSLKQIYPTIKLEGQRPPSIVTHEELGLDLSDPVVLARILARFE